MLDWLFHDYSWVVVVLAVLSWLLLYGLRSIRVEVSRFWSSVIATAVSTTTYLAFWLPYPLVKQFASTLPDEQKMLLLVTSMGLVTVMVLIGALVLIMWNTSLDARLRFAEMAMGKQFLIAGLYGVILTVFTMLSIVAR